MPAKVGRPGAARHRRPGVAGVMAATALILAALGGSLASACVPQAYLVTLQPRSSGPAGAAVTVNGLNLDRGPAEVRWNAPDGPLLGKADGPNVSVPVKIPEASAGLYAVVVLSRQPDGAIGNSITTPFAVTPPSGGESPILVPGPSSSSGPAAPTSSRSAADTALLLAAGGGLVTIGLLLCSLLGRRRDLKRAAAAGTVSGGADRAA